jgi:hypothetical protein
MPRSCVCVHLRTADEPAASWPVPNMQRRLEHPDLEGGVDLAVGLTSFDNVAEMLEEFILQTVAPGKTGCCIRREAEARRSRCRARVWLLRFACSQRRRAPRRRSLGMWRSPIRGPTRTRFRQRLRSSASAPAARSTGSVSGTHRQECLNPKGTRGYPPTCTRIGALDTSHDALQRRVFWRAIRAESGWIAPRRSGVRVPLAPSLRNACTC